MPTFAILTKKPINDVVYNVVTNVVIADSLEDLNSFDYIVEDNKENPAGIGGVYYPEMDNFFPAPEEE